VENFIQEQTLGDQLCDDDQGNESCDPTSFLLLHYLPKIDIIYFPNRPHSNIGEKGQFVFRRNSLTKESGVLCPNYLIQKWKLPLTLHVVVKTKQLICKFLQMKLLLGGYAIFPCSRLPPCCSVCIAAALWATVL
jgi:hypothetical protein